MGPPRGCSAMMAHSLKHCCGGWMSYSLKCLEWCLAQWVLQKCLLLLWPSKQVGHRGAKIIMTQWATGSNGTKKERSWLRCKIRHSEFIDGNWSHGRKAERREWEEKRASRQASSEMQTVLEELEEGWPLESHFWSFNKREITLHICNKALSLWPRKTTPWMVTNRVRNNKQNKIKPNS